VPLQVVQKSPVQLDPGRFAVTEMLEVIPAFDLSHTNPLGEKKPLWGCTG